MHRLLLSLIFVSIFSLANGQRDSLFWSNVMEDKKGSPIMSVISATDSTFYLLKRSDKNFESVSVEEFSADSLKPIRFNEIKFPSIKGLQPVFDRYLVLQGRTLLVTTAVNKQTEETLIFGFYVLSDLSINPIPKLLGSYFAGTKKRSQNYLLYSGFFTDYFTLVLPKEADAGKNEKFELRLFDAQLELIDNKELEVPYLSGKFRIEDVLVATDKSVNILASINTYDTQDLNTSERNIGRDYSFFRYTWGENELKEMNLAFGMKWVYQARLLFNEEGNIQIIGYYSSIVDLIMAGTFSVVIDRETGSIIKSGLKPFPRDFKKQFRPTGATIDQNELGMFELQFVYPNGNKTILMTEKQYTQTSTIYNPATGTYSVINIYNFDEIILSYVGNNGEMIDNVLVPKFQSSTRTYDSYTSFNAYRATDRTYLFYNDNERNSGLGLTSTDYRQLSSGNNSAAVMLEVHDSGLTEKHILFHSSDQKMVFTPNLFFPLNNGVILFAESGAKFQMLKIIFS